MFNVCPQCGLYSETKEIDPAGPFALCPHCGHAHPFLRLPLFVLTGASASGKSTACLHLPSHTSACVFFETDVLWRSEFATPEDDYRSFRNLCLRVAKNISQGGRPVMLCGTAIPEQFETLPERRYLAESHYLAMVCDDDTLLARLQARPQWRNSAAPEVLESMLAFNRWLIENAAHTDPPMTLLDTSALSVQESVAYIVRWLCSRLSGPG